MSGTEELLELELEWLTRPESHDDDGSKLRVRSMGWAAARFAGLPFLGVWGEEPRSQKPVLYFVTPCCLHIPKRTPAFLRCGGCRREYRHDALTSNGRLAYSIQLSFDRFSGQMVMPERSMAILRAWLDACGYDPLSTELALSTVQASTWPLRPPTYEAMGLGVASLVARSRWLEEPLPDSWEKR